MEFVAKDKGGDWHFDGIKTYWCLDKKKNVAGKIHAEYIPDPYKMWESKCLQANVDIKSNEAKVLKPNQVVYKLWEHHYANQ